MKGNASTSLMKTLISKKPSNGITSSGSSLLISKNQSSLSSTPPPQPTASATTPTPISPTSSSSIAGQFETLTSLSPTSKHNHQKQLNKNLILSNLEPLNLLQQNSDSLLSISVSNSQTTSGSSPSSNSPIGTRFALTMLGLTNNVNKSDSNLFQRTQRHPDNSSKCINQEDILSDDLSQSIKSGNNFIYKFSNDYFI